MSTNAEPVASVGLEHYVFIVRRQWRFVLAMLVLGILGALVFLAVVPTAYTATTSVNLNVITTDPFNPSRPASDLLDSATEVDIGTSQAVAAIAAETIPGMDTAEVREASGVSVASGTTVAQVSFTADDPDVAIAGADAVAASYLQYRSTQASERISATLASIDASLASLTERLTAVNLVIANSAAGSQERAQANSEADQIDLEMRDLVSERGTLANLDTTGGTVLTGAEANAVDQSPGTLLTLATGAAAGLFLGIVFAFVVNPLDRRVRNTKEMVRAAELPILARLDTANGTVPPAGRDADALRVLRERVFAEIRSGTAHILIVDATHGTELSDHVTAFAVVTAQAQRNTVLVAPEVSEAQLYEFSDALALEPLEHGAVLSHSAAVPTLHVYVPATPDAAGIATEADLLFTRDVRDTLQSVSPGTVTVISVSVTAHPASVLAAIREADAVVLLLRAGDSTRAEIRRIIAEARGFDTVVLGIVSAPRARRRRARGGESSLGLDASSSTRVGFREPGTVATSASSVGAADLGDDDDIEPRRPVAPRGSKRPTPRTARDTATSLLGDN